jgi:molybdopterin-containing oxidoreductase family iron-sulfur binding subunit
MKPESTDTPATAESTAPELWRGLDERAGLPEYEAAALNEFPEGATEFVDEPSRRRFLALAGASIALATATGCNIRPASQRKIYPYTTQPDQITPGVPLYFASAAPFAGYGFGVLVRSHEGRPIKIEGNPDHSASLGGASIHALASMLDMYDPDRSRGVTHRGQPAGYDEALAAVRGVLYPKGAINAGVKLRVLTGTVTSPTLSAQLNRLIAAFPNTKIVSYEAVSSETQRAGFAKAFGKAVVPVYDFIKADVVVSLDADFLGSGPGQVRYSRDFADRRKIREDGKDANATAEGKRTPEGVKSDNMNRLYAVECMPTNTGAVADHRLPLLSSQLESFARELAKEIGVPGVPAAGTISDEAKAWLKPLADDLKDAKRKGKTIVVAGDHASASLHALVCAINSHLGNIGQTVKLIDSPEAQFPAEKTANLKSLTGELAAGQVDALIVLDVNAAYSAPADIDFAGALKAFGEDKKKFSLHIGQHQDETAVLCTWHVNEAHYLEAWGDIRGYDGTVSTQQPLIAPLHGGKSQIEFFEAVLPAKEKGVSPASRDGHEIVRDTLREWYSKQPPATPAKHFETFWQESVRAGVVANSASAPVVATLAANWAEGSTAAPASPSASEFEINFRACPSLHDGRYANNGWLQELPKPLTKISWDNAAFMSPNTAEKLKAVTNFRWTAGEHGRAEVNVIEIEVAGKKIKAPVWILPGHVDGAITVHLGHGRERVGRVGTSPDEPNVDGKPVRGVNAYPIRATSGLWFANGKVTTVGGGSKPGAGQKYFLACTQGHWAMAEKDPISGKMLDRKPVRKGSLEDYKANPAFAKIPPMAAGETLAINENVPHPKKKESKDGDKKDDHGGHDHRLHPLNMYNPAEGLSPGLKDAQRRRWAMAFDLSACNGCSACLIACISENNIPVVGKTQVTKGREMHWIRIDRYYEGDEKKSGSVNVYFQPVMCVQCENAPCEIVCPVGATVHSTDGLNDMAYNRCVGTRYCSNNCPYKVRRFNFLTFDKIYAWETDTIKLSRNPEVSVRSRGVMEKCTFCVQRIRGAEIVAEREHRSIKDGEILTACQAACPSGAIVFGDLNDAESAVARWKNEPRNYGLLAELNTRPRVTHLATIRNLNPAMPKGA